MLATAPHCPAHPQETPHMKERTLDGFGARLAALRQARGLSH
jgi:hypothetical protein